MVALSDGSVQVGEQIAATLHCNLTMLLMKDIEVPGEGTLFGTVDQNGGFIYNQMFSAGELEEYYSEFHGYLDDQKRQSFQQLNQLLGDGGLVSPEMVKDHVVILVSDGLPVGASLESAAEFLKPIRLQKLIIATPIASVAAVDRAHVIADEIHILSVTDNFLDTNHYYEQNDVPSHEDTIAKINQIVLNWK